MLFDLSNKNVDIALRNRNSKRHVISVSGYLRTINDPYEGLLVRRVRSAHKGLSNYLKTLKRFKERLSVGGKSGAGCKVGHGAVVRNVHPTIKVADRIKILSELIVIKVRYAGHTGRGLRGERHQRSRFFRKQVRQFNIDMRTCFEGLSHPRKRTDGERICIQRSNRDFSRKAVQASPDRSGNLRIIYCRSVLL